MVCTHAVHAHIAHRERQIHSKSSLPSRAALAHLSLKLWLLRCRTNLGLSVPRQTQSLLSWCPSELYLGILLSPFPQGLASQQGQRGSTWGATSLLHSSKKGWHILEGISAALTGPNSQFPRCFAGLQSLHHTVLCREKEELSGIWSQPCYSFILTPLLLPLAHVGGGGTWEWKSWPSQSQHWFMGSVIPHWPRQMLLKGPTVCFCLIKFQFTKMLCMTFIYTFIYMYTFIHNLNWIKSWKWWRLNIKGKSSQRQLQLIFTSPACSVLLFYLLPLFSHKKWSHFISLLVYFLFSSQLCFFIPVLSLDLVYGNLFCFSISPNSKVLYTSKKSDSSF